MSYSEYRKIARDNLAGKWSQAVLVAFVAALLGGLITASSYFRLDMDAEYIHYLPEFLIPLLTLGVSTAGTLNLVHFILGGTVQLGYAQVLLKQHHGADYDVKDLFSQFYRFKQGFLQSFLTGLYVFLWTLLFIIPGIIKAYSYAMTPFIMADNPELTAREAMEQSQALMNGHKGELFILGLTFIGWDLLNVLTLGIGSLWLNPYKNAAYAAFYRDLCPLRRLEEA